MSYKINQVAQKIGVKPQIIRYYEHEGMLSNISRNPNGYRSYSEEDISYIRFLESVKKLKRSGLPLIDLREYAKLINSEKEKNMYVEENLVTLTATRFKIKISLSFLFLFRQFEFW